jgi:hypothetical protein
MATWRIEQRNAQRLINLATTEHARWIELLDSIPQELRWGLRAEVEAMGKYKNWMIDRRNGWARITREDILWLETFIAKMCLPKAEKPRLFTKDETSAQRVELHATVEARQNAIDAFCEQCIGVAPTGNSARCPDATCPLRAFCKAQLSSSAFKNAPLGADMVGA